MLLEGDALTHLVLFMYTSLSTFKEIERGILSKLLQDKTGDGAASTLVYAALRLHSCLFSQSVFFGRFTGNLKKISWLQRQQLSACSESVLCSFLRTSKNWEYSYVPGLDRLAYFWRCVGMQLVLIAEPFDTLSGPCIEVPVRYESFEGDWGLDADAAKLAIKRSIADFIRQLLDSSLVPQLDSDFKYQASGVSRRTIQSWLNMRSTAPLKKVADFAAGCQYRLSLLVRKIDGLN